MKANNELKAELGKIQQQIVKTKINACTCAPMEVKQRWKEFNFTIGRLKGSLDEGINKI